MPILDTPESPTAPPAIIPKNVDNIPIGSAELMVMIPWGNNQSGDNKITLSVYNTPLSPAPNARHHAQPAQKFILPPGRIGHLQLPVTVFDKRHPDKLINGLEDWQKNFFASMHKDVPNRLMELLAYHAVESHGPEIAMALRRAYPSQEESLVYTHSKGEDLRNSITRFLYYAINQPPFKGQDGEQKFVEQVVMQSEGAAGYFKQWLASASESLGKEYNLTPEEVEKLKSAERIDALPAMAQSIAPDVSQRFSNQLRSNTGAMRKLLEAHYERQHVANNVRYRPSLTPDEAKNAAKKYIETLFDAPSWDHTARALRFVRQGFNAANLKFIMVPGNDIGGYYNPNAKKYNGAGASAQRDGTLMLPADRHSSECLGTFSHEIAHAFIFMLYSENKHGRPWNEKNDPRKQLWKEALEADSQLHINDAWRPVREELNQLLHSKEPIGRALHALSESRKEPLTHVLKTLRHNDRPACRELIRLLRSGTTAGNELEKLVKGKEFSDHALTRLLTMDEPVGHALRKLQNDVYTDMYGKNMAAAESMAFIIQKMVEGDWYVPNGYRPQLRSERFTRKSLAKAYPHLTAFVENIVFPDAEHFVKHGVLPEINIEQYHREHPRLLPDARTEHRKAIQKERGFTQHVGGEKQPAERGQRNSDQERSPFLMIEDPARMLLGL